MRTVRSGHGKEWREYRARTAVGTHRAGIHRPQAYDSPRRISHCSGCSHTTDPTTPTPPTRDATTAALRTDAIDRDRVPASVRTRPSSPSVPVDANPERTAVAIVVEQRRVARDGRVIGRVAVWRGVCRHTQAQSESPYVAGIRQQHQCSADPSGP